jgi:hypothetical protein
MGCASNTVLRSYGLASIPHWLRLLLTRRLTRHTVSNGLMASFDKSGAIRGDVGVRTSQVFILSTNNSLATTAISNLLKRWPVRCFLAAEVLEARLKRTADYSGRCPLREWFPVEVLSRVF